MSILLHPETIDEAIRQRKVKSIESLVPTDDEPKEKDKQKKKKFKFELHDEQIFLDFYVWIYSPMTIKQYLIGGLLVIGCTGVCLFPLWPTQVRTGVYYLSIILTCLLGSLLSLAVIKYIIFAIVWFVESFIPFYTVNITKKDEKINESLADIRHNEVEEKDQSTNSKDNNDERQKLAEEGDEVLSKDELETK